MTILIIASILIAWAALVVLCCWFRRDERRSGWDDALDALLLSWLWSDMLDHDCHGDD